MKYRRLGRLAQADIERLSEVFAPGAGAGERFPPHILKTVGL